MRPAGFLGDCIAYDRLDESILKIERANGTALRVGDTVRRSERIKVSLVLPDMLPRNALLHTTIHIKRERYARKGSSEGALPVGLILSVETNTFVESTTLNVEFI